MELAGNKTFHQKLKFICEFLSRLEAVLLPGPFLVRSREELHPRERGPRDLKALEGPAPPVFSATEAHVVLFLLLSLCREGQDTGLAADPGAVERDPPTLAVRSVVCCMCYDPCCLGSGPSSEFAREQRPAESSPKAPLPENPGCAYARPTRLEPSPFPELPALRLGDHLQSRVVLFGPGSCAWKASRGEAAVWDLSLGQWTARLTPRPAGLKSAPPPPPPHLILPQRLHFRL